MYGNLTDQHGFLVEPILLHPKSRGHIKLRSTDPMEQPIIDPNYLKHPADLDVLVDGNFKFQLAGCHGTSASTKCVNFFKKNPLVLTGMRFVTQLEKTEAFKSVGARLSRRIHPLCKDHVWGTDDYWRCFIKHNIQTIHHPASTCKMGPVDETSTVVDPRLR